jgi:hypothetical protein
LTGSKTDKKRKMKNVLPIDDLDLHRAFETVVQSDGVSSYIREIAALVVHNDLTNEHLQAILAKYGITTKDIKRELLDLLITYANIILEDGIITDKERQNFGFLKLYFSIKEGDFYKHKLLEIKEILHQQFEKLYFDNNISKEEAEYSLNLQEMFGLNYEQFDQLKEREIRKALERGANILNLDTANIKLTKLTHKNLSL